MAKEPMIYVTVCVSNPKSLRALLAIQRMSEELAEDQPWSDNARRIRNAAKYLLKNAEMEVGEK